MRIPTRCMGRALVLPLLLLCAQPVLAADKELAHDDGTQADRQSAAGTGHVIRYESPKGDWWIESVRVHGARYGGGYDPATTMFTVTLCDEGLAPLLSFEAPSGLFSFRLGARDRETSVEGVHPEGIGSPPHVFVPYEPALFARSPDPALAVGLDVLRHLVEGAPRDVVVDLHDGLLDPDPDDRARFRKALEVWRALAHPTGLVFSDMTEGLVADRIAGQGAWLASKANAMPDVRGGERRLTGLGGVARILGDERAARMAEAYRPQPAEAAAQAAWKALGVRGFPPNSAAVRAYVKEHAGTRFASAVGAAFD